jgi:SAM-dependent methyltransferase
MSLIHSVKNKLGHSIKIIPQTKGLVRAFRTARNELTLYDPPYIREYLDRYMHKPQILLNGPTSSGLLDAVKQNTYVHGAHVYTVIHATILKYFGENHLPKLKLLDIGCNYGAYLYYLKEKFGMDVSGVDIDKGAVEYAIAAGLNIVKGDARALPFQNNSFDLVISNCFHDDNAFIVGKTLRESDFQYVTLREIHRVLKKGGSYISERSTETDNLMFGDFSSRREISFGDIAFCADPVILLKK